LTLRLSETECKLLQAAAALGIHPETGEKLARGNGKPKLNGSGAGTKLPQKQRAHSGESMEQLSRRLERERREEHRQGWLEYCDSMYKTHLQLAKEWGQKRADLLRTMA